MQNLTVYFFGVFLVILQIPLLQAYVVQKGFPDFLFPATGVGNDSTAAFCSRLCILCITASCLCIWESGASAQTGT